MAHMMFALGSKEKLKKSSKKCCVLASHSLLQINNGWLGDSWIDWSCVHCSEFWKAKPLVLVPPLNKATIFTIGWWSSMIQRPRVQLQCIAMEWGVLQPPGVLQQQRSVRNQPALESFPILRKNPLHMNPPCNSAQFFSQSIEICLFFDSNEEIL